MSGGRHQDQDKESTLYVGNLDERVTDKLVWELLVQAGPVVHVHLPKDRVTQTHQGYGFVEMNSEADAEYAANIMNGIKLWQKPIRVNKANADKRNEAGVGATASVGAELFVGNLDSMVDEKLLYATFERFGRIVAPPKISRDENNLSKGFGFISYDSFEAADAAIANMHGQYFMNKEVTVQYAYKKDGKGERHGDAAERALAAQAQAHGVKVDYQPLPVGLTVPVGTPMGPSNPSYRPPYNPNYYPQGGYGYPNYGQSPYNAGQFPPPSGSYTVPVAPPQPFAPGQTPYGYQPPLTFNTALPPPGTYGAAGQS